MAEDQDKSQQTEEPTHKRLEQARESGDVVKSTELTTFILLGGGTLAITQGLTIDSGGGVAPGRSGHDAGR